MKKLWEALRTPGLNYRAMYDERKNALVSVPAVEKVRNHVILTVVYSLLVIAISGLVATGLSMLLGTLGMGDNMWRDILAASPSGIFLMVAFVVYAPRLGLFPGIFGMQVLLDENNDEDKKVAKVIKNNPSRFNVDWYREWAESPKRNREDILSELKKSLHEVKASQPPKKDKKKEKTGSTAV